MSCAVMTYGEQVCQQLRAETEPLKAVGQKTARPEHLKARRWQQQQTGVRVQSSASIVSTDHTLLPLLSVFTFST